MRQRPRFPRGLAGGRPAAPGASGVPAQHRVGVAVPDVAADQAAASDRSADAGVFAEYLELAGNPEIDCDVLFQYCDLREVYEPLEYLNVALQYDDIPYRKWSSPLDLKEIGMDGLSLHEKCSLQLGWELAGEDATRDRAGMSVEELIDFGETEAENRDLVLWLQGYMDPYEGEIDTAKYSRAEIVDKLLFD